MNFQTMNNNPFSNPFLSAFQPLSTEESFNFNSPKCAYTNELIQVMNAQTMLITKMFEDQKILLKQLNKNQSFSSTGTEQLHDQHQNHSNHFKQDYSVSNGENRLQPQISKQNRESSAKIKSKIPKNLFKYQIESSDSYQIEHHEKSKNSETKNIIKNYGKSILSFIRKNKAKKLKILQHFKVSQEQFQQVLDQFKGKIYSIADLRFLWTEQGSKYGKIMRILSCEYLRKHSLHYIFNSRVQNFDVHIKYRNKLLQSLQNPQEFTSIKLF